MDSQIKRDSCRPSRHSFNALLLEVPSASTVKWWLLCAEGNTRAAIHLETLWNEPPVTHAFSLLCGYPLSGFPGQNHESYHQVRHHMQVHHAEQAR